MHFSVHDSTVSASVLQSNWPQCWTADNAPYVQDREAPAQWDTRAGSAATIPGSACHRSQEPVQRLQRLEPGGLKEDRDRRPGVRVVQDPGGPHASRLDRDRRRRTCHEVSDGIVVLRGARLPNGEVVRFPDRARWISAGSHDGWLGRGGYFLRRSAAGQPVGVTGPSLLPQNRRDLARGATLWGTYRFVIHAKSSYAASLE